MIEITNMEWSIIAFLLLQSITAAKYVANLSTRVAVLEMSHDTLLDDLKEIKQDVKELLRAVHS